MSNLSLMSRVSSYLDGVGVRQGNRLHEASGLHLLRNEVATGIDATIYNPLLCVVLQGAKEVGTGATTLTVRAGQQLVVSHTLPVRSRITDASPERPYVALVFPLDLDLLRSLATTVQPTSASRSPDLFSICVSDTDDDLEDALVRYFRQSEDETARKLLAPITAREIHARLLMGRHSAILKRLLWHESTASRIFQATRDIHDNLAQTIVVGELAHRVGMSNSAFFEQFKAVTGTSPLQYQKDLRLHKARNELQTTHAKVSAIAFSVGYESSAQFSREYSRKFGKSPRQDRLLQTTE